MDKEYYIVYLHLKNIGVKATGKETKRVIVDVNSGDEVTPEDIDPIFPTELVETYECKRSYVCDAVYASDPCSKVFRFVDSTGSSRVVEVTGVAGTTSNPYIYVRDKDMNVLTIGMENNEKNSKNPGHIELPTEEDLKFYDEWRGADLAYEYVMSSLGCFLDDYNDSYDMCPPTRPKWVSKDTLEKIKMILDDEYNKQNNQI